MSCLLLWAMRGTRSWESKERTRLLRLSRATEFLVKWSVPHEHLFGRFISNTLGSAQLTLFQDMSDRAHSGGMRCRLHNCAEGPAAPSLVSRAIMSCGLVSGRIIWTWKPKRKGRETYE